MFEFIHELTFWQNVIASVLGSLVLILLSYVLRIVLSSVKEWTSTRDATREYLERALISNDPPARQEANTQIIFNVLKWSVLSALLWVIGNAIANYSFILAILLQIAGAICLVLALRWVLLNQKLGKVKDADIEKIIKRTKYRLFFNPQRGQSASKIITFGANGVINEGKNNNEHSWRVQRGMLELIQADGQIHSRFTYNPRNRVFNHTNDSDTISIRNQYIVPETST